MMGHTAAKKPTSPKKMSANSGSPPRILSMIPDGVCSLSSRDSLSRVLISLLPGRGSAMSSDKLVLLLFFVSTGEDREDGRRGGILTRLMPGQGSPLS